MQVIFIYGPAASGKHTIGSQLSRLTGLPLFHNHLAVDAALSLFAFGTQGFKNVRAAVWRAAFQEAARSGRSFIFTFHPEASVEPSLITELVASIESAGGMVVFVELLCTPEVVLERLGNPSRANFRKLTDPDLYRTLEEQGAFAFPPLPTPLLRIDTNNLPSEAAAKQIAAALENGPTSKIALEAQSTPSPALRAVKIVHTLAWALFAGCILALPVAAYFRSFRLATLLIAIVSIEIVVLVANRFRCPLTAVAARYTSDRRANFDIYLPMWMARYNKEIFGTLFVAGILFTLVWWRFT
jgi:hypothetical protein